MSEFEIRLVGHSGRVFAVYQMEAESLKEAVERADDLVKNCPEVSGAQVQPAPPNRDLTIH